MVARSAQPRASQERFRRARALLLMTLVAPGWAQVSAGSRLVGGFAMGFAVAAFSAATLLAGLWLVSPRSVLWLLSAGPILPVARWLLLVLAIGWLTLFLDAWRLGRPLTLHRIQRLKAFGLTATLSLVTTTALVVSANYVDSGYQLLSTVFGEGSGDGKKAGRYNILLLGGDAGRTRSGLRPDSITVASVDAETGASVLFGLPRNLQNVPFPKGTVMHNHWPHGFNCGEECLLNAVYTWAESHRELFPNVEHPGVEATKAAVEAITGLQISYTAMIDLQGFRDFVDATGGITIRVEKRVPIAGADSGPIYGWIETGPQRMDGATALWFARSRRDSSDYERMARQKCVLSAMLSQLDPSTVLTSFRSLASASARTIWTDIPATELSDLMKLASRARTKSPETLNFAPPVIKPSDPDYELTRRMVKDSVASANATPPPRSTKPGAAIASNKRSSNANKPAGRPICSPA
jgi:LCP family protein required for cell wall assembly